MLAHSTMSFEMGLSTDVLNELLQFRKYFRFVPLQATVISEI